MFKVILHKAIWNGTSEEESTNCALYKKEIQLPFVPNEKVNVAIPGGRPVALTKITWCIDDELFTCSVPDEYVRKSEGVVMPDFEWRKSHAISCDWKFTGNLNGN
jgi:hypothetical protein